MISPNSKAITTPNKKPIPGSERNDTPLVEEKRSVAGVARELGISANLLHRWKRELCELGKQAFPGKGHLPADQEELRRLRQQLRDVTEERDILKKAIAVFTPKRPHGTGL